MTILANSKTRLLAMPLVFALSLALASSVQAQGVVVYINTTADLPIEPAHCLPGQDYPLRSAVERIQNSGISGTIRACYNPDEFPRGKACPPGRSPMSTDDPGYDAQEGKWTFLFGENANPLTFSSDGVIIDFTADIEGWSSPADNSMILTPGENYMEHGIIIQSSGNIFRGLEIRGDFVLSSIVVREGIFESTATANEFGPGLIFSDNTSDGVGILITDESSNGNRIIGNWCGFRGDGSEPAPYQNECVQIEQRAASNKIGGPEPEDRNIFGGNELGAAIIVQAGANSTVIEGNWLGLNAKGEAFGSAGGGISGKLYIQRLNILNNVISGNLAAAISLYEGSNYTEIRGNRIGLAPDSDDCMSNRPVGVSINNNVQNTLITDNDIACHDRGAVTISGGNARANKITRNRTWTNGLRPIVISSGGNEGVGAPKIATAHESQITGTATSCKGGEIEFYSGSDGDAIHYEGTSDISTVDGTFNFAPDAPPMHPLVVALCHDPKGNSSEFSAAKEVSRGQPVTPTDVPTPTPRPTVGGTLSTVFIPAVEF